MDIQNWAFLLGMILGAAAFISVFYVWIRHQQFGTGGTTLSIVGIILVGLSIWSSVQIKISPEGIEAKLDKLEQQVKTVAEADTSIAQEVEKVSKSIETNQKQLLEISEILERKQVMTPNQAKQIKAQITGVSNVDRKRIEEATRSLQRVAKEVNQ